MFISAEMNKSEKQVKKKKGNNLSPRKRTYKVKALKEFLKDTDEKHVIRSGAFIIGNRTFVNAPV